MCAVKMLIFVNRSMTIEASLTRVSRRNRGRSEREWGKMNSLWDNFRIAWTSKQTCWH